MKFITNKINVIKRRFQRNMFNWKCNTILDTDPLHILKDRVIIISMLRHSDVIMYLVAIKSFYQRFSKGEIVILNDGSLTKRDLSLLKKHILPKDIVHINDIKNSHFMHFYGPHRWENGLYIENARNFVDTI